MMEHSSEENDERAFSFLNLNKRPDKPRTLGITQIRGPYYTPQGKHYLQDIPDTMGAWVDALKFAGDHAFKSLVWSDPRRINVVPQ